MREASEHATYVDTWLDQLPRNLTPEQMVRAFDQALTRLWGRAGRTLGNATLSAIADRVLHEAAAHVPLLAALTVDDGSVQFDELRRRVKPEDVEQLHEGMRSTLIQFLTVMGRISADTLTSVLHVELSNVRVDDLRPADGLAEQAPRQTSERKEA